MWSLTQTINYPGEGETETTLTFKQRHDTLEHIQRIMDRIQADKISSVVFVLNRA